MRQILTKIHNVIFKGNRDASIIDNDDVKQMWDQAASGDLKDFLTDRTWSAIPQTGTNQNKHITGDSNYNWKDYFKNTHFADNRPIRALSMGCGDGAFDRELKQRGLNFKSLTGIDISDACIEKASQEANKVGLADEVDYYVSDLNHIDLPENKFDLIYFFHSLHHVTELESVLRSCRNALKPDGILMVNEYVGESRFQWNDEQIRYADEILAGLPAELKYDHLLQKKRDRVERVKLDDLISMDPSEAVRSGDIDTVIKSIFNVIEEKNCGGTITYLVFDGIASNFRPDETAHSSVIDSIIEKENLLLEQKKIKSDFKYYVAKR